MQVFHVLILCLVVAVALGDDYALVIDAGSTGSRSFVFKYELDESNVRIISSTKGVKVTPGLSSFVDATEDDIKDYILPMFYAAVKIIPEDKHNTTVVYMKGTAGMRLLSRSDQSKLWKMAYNCLYNHEDVPFIINSNNFGTIDGYDEAYYAVLASNYIAGSIDGNLHVVENTRMIGALDMGGSSSQMIFHTHTKPGKKVNAKDFWMHSWLNYGVEVTREKVYAYLIKESAQKNQNNDPNSQRTVSNPCGFLNNEIEFDKVVLKGSGNGTECSRVIQNVLWSKSTCAPKTPCPVDGVRHPPIDGDFYGMSVYFYAFDCIRHIGGTRIQSWPTPTIAELESAVNSFCSLRNHEANRSMQIKKHKYTRPDQLQYRCLEGVYLLNLLENGFGFNRHSRNITLALDIKGHEAEWTLGFALAEILLPAHQFIRESNPSLEVIDMEYQFNKFTKSIGTSMLHGLTSIMKTLYRVHTSPLRFTRMLFQNKYKSINSELQEIIKNNQAKLDRLTLLEEAHVALNSQIATLTDEKVELLRRAEDNESMRQQLQNALQALADEKTRSNEAINAVQTELKNHIEKLENSIKICTDSKTAAASTISELTNKLAVCEQSVVDVNRVQDELHKCNDDAVATRTLLTNCQESQINNGNLKDSLEKCNKDTLATQSSHAAAIIDVERKLLKLKDVHREEIKKLESQLTQCNEK